MNTSVKQVSLSLGGNPVSITRRRKNSDTNDRVERAVDILNDIGSKRPEWGVTETQQKKKDTYKPLDTPMCSICVTEIGDSEGRYTTSCGHSFHLECVLPWFARSTYCPNCRKKDIKNPISLNNNK